uniref:Glycosyltransferase n=1 Tax=Wollemia nobilis TaxID=56998 RepID=A0A0C9RU17_9CONI
MGRLGSLENNSEPHIMVFPYPGQGHINPLMEFAKRLARKHVRVTFVLTQTSSKRMFDAQDAAVALKVPDLRFETISDGLPSNFDRLKEVDMVLHQLRTVGGASLEHLIKTFNAQGKSVSCIVFGSFGLEWLPEVAKKFNIPTAFLWCQPCAVYSAYYHYTRGLIETEAESEMVEIPGLPQLRREELPSFLHPSSTQGTVRRHVLLQFETMSEAKWVLVNSFDQLEEREIKSMESVSPIRTVGPLVPLGFVEGNSPENAEVVPHLWKAANCLEWLDTKGASTVVYVSFGSIAAFSKKQLEEIAIGLKASGNSFLWVVRPGANKGESNSAEDLPEGFVEETVDRGLVVPWSPQMQVLSHPSVGVFLTHCGWNSTMESLCCGVPMIAFPQWSDQTTISKYVEDEWKTGLRLNKRADGLIGREEVEKSIRTVMESERGVQLRGNALRWKTLAREAMVKGGPSDKNIEDFVEEIIATSFSMSEN